MVGDRQTSDAGSFDVNPSSREVLQDLTRMGATFDLIAAGARMQQPGAWAASRWGRRPRSGTTRCAPSPGAPAPRRTGVWLCSPETGAASTLTVAITDPRDLAKELGVATSDLDLPAQASVNTSMPAPPLAPEEAQAEELRRGGNISTLPRLRAAAERAAGAPTNRGGS
jgi:aconitate hydratase